MTKHTKKLLFLLTTISLIVIILFFLFKPGSKKQNTEPTSMSQFLLGTVIDLKLYDAPSQKAGEKILNEAFSILKRIEDKMSINIESSEISQINKNAGLSEVIVSDETFFVIDRGEYYSKLSGGHFDISIGPLVRLWGIGTDSARVPSPNEIIEAKKRVGYKKVILDKEKKSVKLEEKDMMLDLGGIAKGYAADAIAEYFYSKNIKSAIINLGGNVYALGSNVTGKPWRIGIQNPFDARGKSIGLVHVKDKTVVTSGIYERYFEYQGKHYHHILNPFKGYPVENNLASITIITDKSIDADGLSTTVFALGIEKGKELVETLKGVDVIFVTKDKKVYKTSGLKKSFEMTNSEFTLVE